MKRWIMAQALLGGGTTWKIRPIIPSIVVTTPTSLEHHHITHQQPSSSTTTITRYYYYSSSTYHPTLEQPPSKSMSTSFQSWFGLVFIRNQFWKYSTSATTATNTRTLTVLRGGGGDGNDGYNNHNNNHNATTEDTSHTEPQNSTKFTVLSDPAPGSPFHYAFPVHDLHLAKEFYGTILGCVEGRSSTKWQDYSLHGHQIVAHWVGDNYRCQDYYNPVDGDEVPVPRTSPQVYLDHINKHTSLYLTRLKTRLLHILIILSSFYFG